MQKADQARRGFALSIAGASAWTVPDSAFSDGKLSRWGAWVTPSYRPGSASVELIAVVRFAHRPDAGGDSLIDVGGRVTQATGDLNWSGEYIERIDRASGASSVKSERVAAVIEYRLRDDAYFSASFGKDFADPTNGTPKGGLLATLGLSLGFGEKPTIKLP